MKLTREQVSQLSDVELNRAMTALSYNEVSGKFLWVAPYSNRVLVGDEAGSIDAEGYRVIKVKSKRYKANRLALMFLGFDVKGMQVDHINGDRLDNRSCNLRLVTHSGNQQNQALSKSNTSGVIGVYWCDLVSKWNPRITHNGVKFNLGYYKNKDIAIELRQFAEKICGFHENHGRKPTTRNLRSAAYDSNGA